MHEMKLNTKCHMWLWIANDTGTVNSIMTEWVKEETRFRGDVISAMQHCLLIKEPDQTSQLG